MAQTNQKLSRAALKQAALRHNWTLQWCWNYERMQAYGFAYSLVPVMKELYDTEEEVCENLERHMDFYQSHPGTSAIIFGASAALEEKYQKNIAASAKTALMGPLGSIGDAFQTALVQPFACLISAALALGSWPGNLFSIPMLFIPFLLYFGLRWPFFWWGYNQSIKSIDKVKKPARFSTLMNASQILGLTVMGGLIPSILSGLRLNITRVQTINGINVGDPFDLQIMLDGLFPFLAPIGIVAFCYWMFKHRGLPPVKTVVITAVITFILGVFRIL